MPILGYMTENNDLKKKHANKSYKKFTFLIH